MSKDKSGKHRPETRAQKFEQDRQKRLKEDEDKSKGLDALTNILPPQRGKENK